MKKNALLLFGSLISIGIPSFALYLFVGFPSREIGDLIYAVMTFVSMPFAYLLTLFLGFFFSKKYEIEFPDWYKFWYLFLVGTPIYYVILTSIMNVR